MSESITEDSPLSVETPAIPAHGSNAQANSTHHMDTAVLQGITNYSYPTLRKEVSLIETILESQRGRCWLA